MEGGSKLERSKEVFILNLRNVNSPDVTALSPPRASFVILEFHGYKVFNLGKGV